MVTGGLSAGSLDDDGGAGELGAPDEPDESDRDQLRVVVREILPRKPPRHRVDERIHQEPREKGGKEAVFEDEEKPAGHEGPRGFLIPRRPRLRRGGGGCRERRG